MFFSQLLKQKHSLFISISFLSDIQYFSQQKLYIAERTVNPCFSDISRIYFSSFKKRSKDPTEKIKRLVLRCIYFVKSKFSHHQQLVKIIELQKSMKVFQYQNETNNTGIF